MAVWLRRDVIQAIHVEQLAQHGGSPGLRDEGLLESALARPLNHAGYTDCGIPELAAIYAVGLCKNHPFIDGNKRVAYVALETFLLLNGYGFPATDAEAVVATLDLAAGELSEQDFIAWVKDKARPVD